MAGDFSRRRPTSSTSEPQSFVEIDLESGQPSDSLRDQSKRLSRFLSSKTELYRLDPATPDPPEQISCHRESSGLKYWLNEACMAKEHGGDYPDKSRAALRAALGSLVTFSALVFPHQQVLGAVWIGNIFMHSNLKDSFGASLTSVRGFGRSIIMTTALSWPFSFCLSMISNTHACFILPIFILILSFAIMSCPQLTSRNLMILVMYIVLAAPVRGSIPWWMPFGYCGTYLVGLAVALLVNVPNFALRSTHRHLSRLEKDLTMLLLQSKAYSEATASAHQVSRAAVASIEMLHARIADTVRELKAGLPASGVELSFLCKARAAGDLSEWAAQTDRMLAPLESLRAALVQRVTGEEHTMYSPHLRDAKETLNREIGPARDRMVDAMIAAVAVCHAWADPSSHRTVLPDVHGELDGAISECRQALPQALGKAAEQLEANPQTNNPIFAHLTRRMSAFSALFELGDSLLAYLEKHSWEAQEIQDKSIRKSLFACVCNFFRSFIAYVEVRWLWYNPDSFRLAIKTSVGMFLASMFVSVPYLWNISDPYGIWPGLTVASVNLATTGSSFHKAADRLFGTLLAAAFALLVSDLFPGNNDWIKVPAIAVFTFAVIYLQNDEHAYKYTYAATSIGSMLYGSVKNDFNVTSYIPKRIELIFVGVVIFSLVELLLFPRSSRRIVETFAFQFFLSVRDYLRQAAFCAKRMEEYVAHSTTITKYGEALFEEVHDPFHLEKLAECHKKLKKESSKLKKELDPGLNEPHLGLSMALHPESFRGLAKEFVDCEIQAFMLLKALKALGAYYREEGHPIRELNWPHVHAEFLQDAFVRTDHACEWLKAAYPDGRLRAQQGNSVKAVTAAASFRALEDVRLRTISGWSENYLDFIKRKGFEGSDPVAILTLGITTMCILELCHRMQKAGKCVEKIAHHFPAFK